MSLLYARRQSPRWSTTRRGIPRRTPETRPLYFIESYDESGAISVESPAFRVFARRTTRTTYTVLRKRRVRISGRYGVVVVRTRWTRARSTNSEKKMKRKPYRFARWYLKKKTVVRRQECGLKKETRIRYTLYAIHARLCVRVHTNGPSSHVGIHTVLGYLAYIIRENNFTFIKET